MTRLAHSVCRGLAAFPLMVMLAGAASVPTTKVLYSFTGNSDGGYPDTDLVVDAAGNLYGSSVEGGTFDSGAVFKLSPSTTGWTETVLYSFTGGIDGGQPYGGVTLDAQGNLYGTAVVGGSFAGSPCVESGCGVVFKLTNSGGTWTYSAVHKFAGGNDGYGPGSGLTFDGNSNFYGMTPTGGANGLGVIYQIHVDQNGNHGERVIHTFAGASDGATGSAGRLLLDKTGNLYGVATVGGANGAGTAFKLSRGSNGAWNFETLYSFQGQTNAGFPYGALTADAAGNFYGTTYYSGANGIGAVYELSPVNGAYQERLLYSFAGGADGSYPISNLVSDAAGNLYGTTSEGGASCSCGTIFRLHLGNDGNWKEEVVHRFKGAPDGGFSYNGMVAGPAGVFYGTTVHGGTNDEGSIYQFTP